VARRGLAEEIFTELHTTVEEDFFYPEVRQGDDELEDMVAEGLEELLATVARG